MSYFEVYQKRVNRTGTPTREHREEKSKDAINRNFDLIHGYKEATLVLPEDYHNRHQTTVPDGSPFEVVIRSTNDELVKNLMLRPDTQIPNGSYISINNENRTYIVNTVQMDGIAPSAKAFLCNATLKIKGCPYEFPVYENSTTFGTKGVVDNGGSKFLELDSKTRAYLQYNNFTKKIPLGYRFIFKNRYVYYVTEIDHMVFDHFIMTLKITERHPDDDFENGIAWNETEIDFSDELGNNQIQETYIIDGDMSIALNKTEEYFTNNDVARWEVVSIDGGNANIISQDRVSVVLRATTKGLIELVATYDDGNQARKIILIS